ncbi:cytochrome P450 [Streptomyces sp. BPTC-684]|uniref:cytochrome P450 n=1 Tax=Streptomyces sp. BPTC-684 TaxID=3043734 RepID=UPI0024B255BF|nr:cytochrome P450 [Streptomyces sp. BPTC-684]WHM35904.1 cytochrome P450 [Streptomyces sp. BPTC-684]
MDPACETAGSSGLVSRSAAPVAPGPDAFAPAGSASLTAAPAPVLGVPAAPSLLGPEAVSDRYGFYRTLRESYPLVWDDRLGAWLVSRYGDVAAALGDPGLVRPRRGPCCWPGEVWCEGPRREVDAEAFGVLREVSERTAFVLARRLAQREVADLAEEFCHWLPLGTAATALGLSYAELVRGSRAGGRRAGPAASLAVLCADRSALIGKALSSLLANLLDRPVEWAAVRAAPGALAAAWCESLRRNPPVHVVLRRARVDTRIADGTVPAGAAVALLIGAASRDPDRFAAPDRFDPCRTAPAQLAFGPPDCPAARVAELQAECAVRALCEAMPKLRWAEGFRPTETGLLTRAPRTLLVRPA